MFSSKDSLDADFDIELQNFLDDAFTTSLSKEIECEDEPSRKKLKKLNDNVFEKNYVEDLMSDVSADVFNDDMFDEDSPFISVRERRSEKPVKRAKCEHLTDKVNVTDNFQTKNICLKLSPDPESKFSAREKNNHDKNACHVPTEHIKDSLHKTKRDSNCINHHEKGVHQDLQEHLSQIPSKTACHSKILFSPHSELESLSCSKLSNVDTPKRKFPGPAGFLTVIKSNTPVNKKNKANEASHTPAQKDERLTVFEYDEYFQKKAWIRMCSELKQTDEASIIKTMNLSWVKHLIKKDKWKNLPNRRVPVLIIVLKSLKDVIADASAVFIDCTDEIQGTIHRKLMKDYENILKPGAVLVLQQVLLFSPSPGKPYLNITPKNLIRVYATSVADEEIVKCLLLSNLTTSDIINLGKNWNFCFENQELTNCTPVSSRSSIVSAQLEPINSSWFNNTTAKYNSGSSILDSSKSALVQCPEDRSSYKGITKKSNNTTLSPADEEDDIDELLGSINEDDFLK